MTLVTQRERERGRRKTQEQLDVYTTDTAGQSSCHFKGESVTQIQRQTNQEFREKVAVC